MRQNRPNRNNKNNKNNKNKSPRNLLVLFLIIIAMLSLVELSGTTSAANGKITFSEFMDRVDAGEIEAVAFRGDNITGTTVDGETFNVLVPYYPDLITELREKDVAIEKIPTESGMSSFLTVLLSWFPILLLIGVWIYFMRNMQGGGGKAMGFGKSRAKLVNDKNNKITFADVAGVDEAKEELTELVEFLRNPQKFSKLGGKIPKGCLLVGPPGTGKTLIAKAVAGEANVPFFNISGSDFVEMFVGVGASRVRDMFEQARKQSPCIVFIDEIDAVGRHRGAGLGGGNDEREQTLNQLLVEMDGFAPHEGVIVIAATNRPDVLDPALLRPGRFDRQVTVPSPDVNGREQILRVHSKKVPLDADVDLRVIARGTPGFSGADLANLINEGAIYAARQDRAKVMMHDLEEAKDKVMMGAERRSMVMKDEEKKLTAYHEGGHALVTVLTPASDPIHKATIIPRGRALGMVMRLPEDDRFSNTREKLEADIAVAMGGRVAEELIFGHDKVTSGASSDIKMATSLARSMVTQWGLSDEIGPVLVGDEREEVFLGHSLGHENKNSEKLAETIDAEIRKFVDKGYESAKKLLRDNLDKLHLLAESLLEYETLTGQEIIDLLDGKKIRTSTKKSGSKGEGSSAKRRKRTSTPKIEIDAGEAPQEI